MELKRRIIQHDNPLNMLNNYRTVTVYLRLSKKFLATQNPFSIQKGTTNKTKTHHENLNKVVVSEGQMLAG
jgi:hypothetical protein